MLSITQDIIFLLLVSFDQVAELQEMQALASKTQELTIHSAQD